MCNQFSIRPIIAYFRETGTIVARAASVLSDGIVLVLTMKKTYSNARQSAGLEVHDILLGAILRDGQRALPIKYDVY